MSPRTPRAAARTNAARSVVVGDRGDLVGVHGVDRRLGAHHGDLRGRQRERGVGLEARPGHRVEAGAVGLAHDHRDFGTVASATAVIILAPWRMMPCRSTAVPTMNPGTSARNSSGMLNASHSQMNRARLVGRVDEQHAALDAPSCWRRCRPTAPSSRPKPMISSRANSGLISKNEPVVDQRVDHRVHVERPAARRPAPGRGSSATARLGTVERPAAAPPVRRQVREVLPACVDRLGVVGGQEVAARRTPSACIRAPPISSSVVFSPMTISAIRWRAEVHRGVALDHDHDVAERRDVGAAGRATARTGSRSAGPCRTARTWLWKISPGAPPAGEQVDLVGDPGARPSRPGRTSAARRVAPAR